MTSEEIKALRKGDVVLVRMVLDEDPVLLLTHPPKWGVSLDGLEPAFNGYYRPEDVVSVEPRPLAVGDQVTTADSSLVGEIRAIEGQGAWVKWPAGDYTSEHISDLCKAAIEARKQ